MIINRFWAKFKMIWRLNNKEAKIKKITQINNFKSLNRNLQQNKENKNK